jgi:hypothetical protein
VVATHNCAVAYNIVHMVQVLLSRNGSAVACVKTRLVVTYGVLWFVGVGYLVLAAAEHVSGRDGAVPR